MRENKTTMKVNLVVLAAAVFLFLGSLSSQAKAGESSEAIRGDHPLGGYVTMWGDPFPALLGANIAYNVYDFVRVTGGVGTDSQNHMTATTFGVGTKVFVPGWALSPVAGLNWSVDSGNTFDARGLKHGGNRLYGGIGVDWQTKLGLALGVGYNRSFASNEGGSGYIQAGFFL